MVRATEAQSQKSFVRKGWRGVRQRVGAGQKVGGRGAQGQEAGAGRKVIRQGGRSRKGKAGKGHRVRRVNLHRRPPEVIVLPLAKATPFNSPKSLTRRAVLTTRCAQCSPSLAPLHLPLLLFTSRCIRGPSSATNRPMGSAGRGAGRCAHRTPIRAPPPSRLR